MATVTESVLEQANLVSPEPRNSFVFFLRGTSYLNDYVTVVPGAVQREIATLQDYLVDNFYARLRDTAELNDYVSTGIRLSETVREQANLVTTPYDSVLVTQSERDTAQLNDYTHSQVQTVAHDTAELNDYALPDVVARATVHDSATLASRAVPAVGLNVRETAQLNDYTTRLVTTSFAVRETAQLNDYIHLALAKIDVLRDTASALSMATLVLHRSGMLHEIGYVEGNATPPAYGRAYTCSIITWGMSIYSNFAFTHLAGDYASGNNLWKLGAADDYGTPISSHVTTNTLDMGAAQMKRLSAVYVSGSANDPLTVTVTGDVNGVKSSYDYELSMRDQTDYRNNRALIGKGFRSRYVRVKIGGTGIDYRLISADADVAVSQRRI